MFGVAATKITPGILACVSTGATEKALGEKKKPPNTLTLSLTISSSACFLAKLGLAPPVSR